MIQLHSLENGSQIFDHSFIFDNLTIVLKRCSPELVLKKENVINNEGSFLDICIEIENNQFFIQLFSKKDDFLSKMQYPIRIFFSKYESEILRAARTTSSKLVFERIKKKIKRTCKQTGRIKTFSHTLAKVFGMHFQTFLKSFPTPSYHKVTD